MWEAELSSGDPGMGRTATVGKTPLDIRDCRDFSGAANPRRLPGGGGVQLDWSRAGAREWAGGWALEPSPGDSLTLSLSKGTWTKTGAESRAGCMD